MWNPIKGGDEMKKLLKYVGAVLGGGFAAIYAGLYYRAMHPKCPKPDKSRKRIACVGDSITYGYGFMGLFGSIAIRINYRSFLAPLIR